MAPERLSRQMVPVADGVPAHEALSNSRLINYAGLGHFGPFEAPDVIADDALAAVLGG